MSKECIKECDIQLVFDDNKSGMYYVDCYDGYGEATLDKENWDNDEGVPETVKMKYPTKAEVLADEDLSEQVLEYRGLYDLGANDIHYGDIMMCLGEIVSNN